MYCYNLSIMVNNNNNNNKTYCIVCRDNGGNCDRCRAHDLSDRRGRKPKAVGLLVTIKLTNIEIYRLRYTSPE